MTTRYTPERTSLTNVFVVIGMFVQPNRYLAN